MDNQNNNKGGSGAINIFSNGEKKSPQEDFKMATDASGQVGHENVIVHPQNYENVQTQSKVESAREDADRELAKIKAYNEEMLRRQRADERKVKAKRTAIFLMIGAIVLIFVVVLVWVVVNALMTVNTPPAPSEKSEEEQVVKYDVVDGYQCKTQKCYMVTELPDHRYLVRDDNFFIYNKTTGDITATTVSNQEYHSISAFTWGESILLELDPESESSGLYSVTENRLITGYAYDSFYKDIKDDVYKEMNWVYGQYIIARANGSYRLVRLVDAKEVVRGNLGVFIYDQFLFDYESDGVRHLYTMDGNKFKTTNQGSALFVNNKTHCLIFFKDESTTTFEVYDATGAKLTSSKSEDYQTITKQKSKERLNFVRNSANYYEIYTK